MKTLALNILDIVQNSIRAGADEICISITESAADDFYQIIIADNGNGIPSSMLNKITDPFVTTRTTRKIGMGLALLRHHAELAGGTIKIISGEGTGTQVKAVMSFSHIDRQPLGDITGVLGILIAANQDINFIYRHNTENGEYLFSSEETKRYLEVETLYGTDLLNDIGAMINENLVAIKVSGLELKAEAL
jgi:DNA mismatch repair ATPase MutL